MSVTHRDQMAELNLAQIVVDLKVQVTALEGKFDVLTERLTTSNENLQKLADKFDQYLEGQAKQQQDNEKNAKSNRRWVIGIFVSVLTSAALVVVKLVFGI